MSKRDIVRQLSEQIRQLERPKQRPDSEFHETLTGIEAFDALLPTGGFTGGSMIEWLSPQGGGGSTLATILAARMLGPHSALVVVDSQTVWGDHAIYPPAFHRLGIPLEQLVIVRPQHIGETLWAFEQSLRCSGVTITMAWIDHLTDHVFRRLQLAAEAGGGVGFLFRPSRFRQQRSWADARLLVQPVSRSRHQQDHSFWNSSGQSPVTGIRRLLVELLHCRGRIEGGQVELEINDETGDVRLASRVAPAANLHRKTGA